MAPRFLIGLLAVSFIVLGANSVCGQNYPNKPLRILTGSVGGGSDFTARQIAQGISGPLGQQIVVENRTGVQATEAVSKAPPDGYTLLVFGSSIWILPLLQKVPYDVNSVSSISLVSREIYIVAVHPSVPVKTVRELIALTKARPGAMNYGSGSTGAPNHLAAELFKSMAGVDIVRVAYKGGGPAITAQVSGETQLTFLDVSVTMPHVKSGRLRALAVTSADPSPLVPALPTVAATGLPGFEIVGMTVVAAPAKTPASVVTRLNQEIVRFLNQPDAKERFLNAGSEPVGNSPEQIAAIVKSDVARMGKVIKDAGIKVD